MSKGGGSTTASNRPQEITTTQTNLPAYAEPYFRQGLERSIYESMRPYESFPGQRIQDFTSQERAAMQGMEGMAQAGSPAQFLDASNIARNVGYQGSGMGMNIANQFQPQSIFSQFNPQGIQSQYQGSNIDTGYQARDLFQGYQAGQRQPGYVGSSGFGPGFSPGTIADPQTIERYTNPYQQLVTDVEKREAARQSNILGSQIGQQAAQTGGMGGYREAIMQAERERNLGQQLGDIQTRGSQAGFQQAQQAFEADRAARLQAGQLGLQTGEARQAALQAEERFAQQQFIANEQLRQQQQESELRIYQAQEQARQQAASMGMSAQEIEDRGRQAADQARLEADRFNIEAQRQADEARLGAERFNIEAQRQRSELGLRGLGADQAATAQRLEAARMLGGFGDQQQRMDYERLRNLQASGEIQRQLNQQGLTMGYEDFLRQQAYPREQLGFFNQMLRGLPITPGQSMATYGGPSSIERLLGSGISGVGLYNALNRQR